MIEKFTIIVINILEGWIKIQSEYCCVTMIHVNQRNDRVLELTVIELRNDS